MPGHPSRDWFRKVTWSADDERDFRTRLKRARAHNRPQYLRIQALHLIENGLPEPALQLLNEMFAIAPDDLVLNVGYEARARALIDLGRIDEALAAYRAALQAQRARPNVVGHAALDFAELVVATQRHALFDEALQALDEFAGDDPFPAIHYRDAAVRALIADARGDHVTARRHAMHALEAADVATAPFPRHPGLGLVRAVDPTVHAKLRAMCAV